MLCSNVPRAAVLKISFIVGTTTEGVHGLSNQLRGRRNWYCASEGRKLYVNDLRAPSYPPRINSWTPLAGDQMDGDKYIDRTRHGYDGWVVR